MGVLGQRTSGSKFPLISYVFRGDFKRLEQLVTVCLLSIFSCEVISQLVAGLLHRLVLSRSRELKLRRSHRILEARSGGPVPNRTASAASQLAAKARMRKLVESWRTRQVPADLGIPSDALLDPFLQAPSEA